MKRWMIILILMAPVALREFHLLFSWDLQPGFFPLDKNYLFPPAWYYTFTLWKSMCAVTYWLWWYRERTRDKTFARFILILAIFYSMDLLLFLLINSQAGVVYGMGILTVLIYGTYIIVKKQ